MKQLFYIFLLLVPIFIFSQENNSEIDSIPKSEKELFIKDHTKQLNVKFEVSNDIQEYKIPFDENYVKIKPNLNIRYAFVFSYKFASIRLGIRPSSTNQDEKGDPKSFRFRFQLLFEKWSHRFEYNQVKGYYVKDTDINAVNTLNDVHIQFPNLITKVYSGTTAYKLNKYYSVRSTVSQTETQLKSAGSFIPSIDYWFYSFDGFDKYINPNGEEITRTNYIDSSGIDLVLNLGYHYTFVYDNWYATAYAVPGLGVDFNKTTRYSPIDKTTINYTNFVMSIQSGVGVGYNGEKYFLGASINSKKVTEKDDPDKIQFHTTKNTFFIFFGYRFKAPKTISKPIDGLEEKIPMLNKNS